MKDFLWSILGGTYWAVLMFILNLLIIIPLLAMGLPWWVTIIFYFVIFIVNDTVSCIIQQLTWVLGLIFVIINPQDWFSILYYILFVAMEIPPILNIVSLISHRISDIKDTTSTPNKQHSNLNNTDSNDNYEVNEDNFKKVFKLVGLTFENRQANLKHLYLDLLSYKHIDVKIKKYLYNGSPAIKILANNLEIGNISKDDVHFFLDEQMTFRPTKIYVNHFKNEYNKLIYYASITVEFKKNPIQDIKNEHIKLLSVEEQKIYFMVQQYIDEDIKNNIVDYKNTFTYAEKPIYVSISDIIELRVPDYCKGKYVCGFDIESTRKRVVSSLPLKFNDKHVINILTLSLTLAQCVFADFLHFNRIAIIETIIYTTAIYIFDLTTNKKYTNVSINNLTSLIAETIEYLFDIKGSAVFAMFYTRLSEYLEFAGRKDTIVLLMSILTKHIQYLYEYKAFSFSKFPYIDMKKEDSEYLIEHIKKLTNETLNINKE